MKSIHSEIHGRPAPQPPAPTVVSYSHTRPPFENQDMKIPQDSTTSTKKRILPEDSEKPSSKRCNIFHGGSFSETSSNDIPSNNVPLTENEPLTVTTYHKSYKSKPQFSYHVTRTQTTQQELPSSSIFCSRSLLIIYGPIFVTHAPFIKKQGSSALSMTHAGYSRHEMLAVYAISPRNLQNFLVS